MTKNTFFIIGYCLALGLDYIIRKGYLGNTIKTKHLNFVEKSYFFIFIYNFIFNFYLVLIIEYLGFTFYLIDLNYDFNLEIFNNMADKNIKLPPEITGEVKDNTININHSNFNLSLSNTGASIIAAAMSSTGGAAAAYIVATKIPGGPGINTAAVIGKMVGVQATTVIMSKVLNKTNNNNYDANKSNFIANFLIDEQDKLNNINSNFPFNLLPEMNILINVNLLFLGIILNSFIVSKLTNYNYSKYIPQNRFGKIINILISKYIKIWSKNSKYVIIYSWIMIFVFTLVLKVAFYLILNN